MNENNRSLEDTIFNKILVIAIIASLICIIGNYISGFPFYLDIKWIVIILLSLIVKNLMVNESYINIVRFIYFLILIVFFIPYGFIESGGSSNNTIAYVFLVMLSLTYFFRGYTRRILLGLLITTFTVLIIVEYKYPSIIYVHSTQSQLMDRVIQVPLTLIGGYLLLKQFADAFNKERAMLKQYSEDLQIANKELDYMANHDSLTGMFNRRMFDKKLDEVFNSSLEDDIFIVLFDIDYFKHLNDSYGHGFGDTIICCLASIASKIMPKGTIISRWGGDEFAMIVFASKNVLSDYINSLNTSIKEFNFDHSVKVSISMGITQISSNDTKNEVFKRADKALYESKNNGKNQYTIAE